MKTEGSWGSLNLGLWIGTAVGACRLDGIGARTEGTARLEISSIGPVVNQVRLKGFGQRGKTGTPRNHFLSGIDVELEQRLPSNG